MALKIRLRRMGRKKAPHYRIVIAESVVPRDARFVATIGHYDPTTQPETLKVDRDKALAWMAKGAVPTDTVHLLLKKSGLYKQPSVVEKATSARNSAVSTDAAAAEPEKREASGAAAEAELRSVNETLHWVHEELGLTYKEIGAALDVSERTLRRWRSLSNTPRLRQKDRLEDFNELRHVAAEVFSDPADRREWLYSRNPLLRGRTPISLLRAGRISPVVETLATLESGAFA